MHPLGLLLASVAFLLPALPSAAAGPAGSRLRLEGASASGGGALLRGPSGLLLDGAVVAAGPAGVLVGPRSGRVLHAGFVGPAFRPFTDADGDGVADLADDCLAVADPGQRDSNGDGYGNACDADLDDDGVVGFPDLARLRAAFLGSDADADLDGDGVVSFADLARLRASMFRPPGPSGLRP